MHVYLTCCLLFSQPRGPWGWIYNGPAFEPVCEESAECKAFSAKARGPGDAHNPCRCSGDGIGDLATMEMVDKVHIPADLPAGEYVVGWRCESSPRRPAFARGEP